MNELFYFRNPVHIGGRDFRKGNQTVPENIQKHPHFLKYVNLGWIEQGSTSIPSGPPKIGFTERKEKLLNRLVDSADAAKQASFENKTTVEQKVEDAEMDFFGQSSGEQNGDVEPKKRPRGRPKKSRS